MVFKHLWYCWRILFVVFVIFSEIASDRFIRFSWLWPCTVGGIAFHSNLLPVQLLLHSRLLEISLSLQLQLVPLFQLWLLSYLIGRSPERLLRRLSLVRAVSFPTLAVASVSTRSGCKRFCDDELLAPVKRFSGGKKLWLHAPGYSFTP